MKEGEVVQIPIGQRIRLLNTLSKEQASRYCQGNCDKFHEFLGEMKHENPELERIKVSVVEKLPDGPGGMKMFLVVVADYKQMVIWEGCINLPDVNAPVKRFYRAPRPVASVA